MPVQDQGQGRGKFHGAGQRFQTALELRWRFLAYRNRSKFHSTRKAEIREPCAALIPDRDGVDRGRGDGARAWVSFLVPPMARPFMARSELLLR